MREIKESDWKTLKQLHPEALERFCRQILSEIESINSDGRKNFHQKYLDIYRLIQKRDKEMAQTFDDLRRSTALAKIMGMKSRGLLTQEEYLRFSEETRDMIDRILAE